MKNKHAIIVVITIVTFIALFALIFCLYDSPAKLVKNEKGEVYINADGNPIIYYTDLFGNSFQIIDGKRDYSAEPAFVGSDTVTFKEDTVQKD